MYYLKKWEQYNVNSLLNTNKSDTIGYVGEIKKIAIKN